MIGKIHSTLSFGTVDGPGIRYVLFLQGCPLRCLYCHNPDTWDITEGTDKTIDEVVNDILKYKRYFSNNGGVTLSGGEPLSQIDFVIKLCKALKKENIHICIDTSGITFTNSTLSKYNELIEFVDLFLLDIKHIDEKKAIELTKVSNENTLNFAKYLSDKGKDMWIKYVLVPNFTDDVEDLKSTRKFIDSLNTVKKVEILPYHKMGIQKYEELNINYPLEGVNEPSDEQIDIVKDILIRGNLHD